ncbi:MAG: hypothetical protein IPK26_09810 [Planctomycetes bacterium]|nr:hypothetical protein [Planctomycetota bacterium]
MPRSLPYLALTLIAGWLVVQFVAVGWLPGLADDHVLREGASRFTGFADAFDPRLVPPRPLQHLTFHCGWRLGDAGFAWQRALNFAFLAASLAMVAALARQAGASPGVALLAVVAFACFPTGRAVWWPAAVSGPARTAAILVALWCFGRSTPLAAVGAVVAMVFALFTHQSAVLIPALCVAWVALRQPSIGAAWRALWQPARLLTLTAMAAAVAFALWFYTRVPDQHLAERPLASVLANATWTNAWWWPEWLRVLAVDGVRGEYGGAIRAIGGGLLLIGAAFVVWFLWRGGPLARFAVVAGAADLALPVLTAGWSLRYAMPAGAFLAIALASAGRGRRSTIAVGSLLVCWLADSVHALGEFRAASALSDRLVLQAADERRREPATTPIVVLDLPDVYGRERDVAVANWGFAEAVAALGAAGELRLVRTRAHRTSSASQPIHATEAERLRRAAVVLEYDPERAMFVVWRNGRRGD